jgi:phosphorylated CTD-interacting factor 1
VADCWLLAAGCWLLAAGCWLVGCSPEPTDRDSAPQHALSFCVFLPGWKEDGGYQKLSNSKFLRRLVLIAASDHGYCDGAAYQRQDPYRFSPYDTAVFVLQTDKASRKWPADDKFEKELRTVFAECTPSENAVKRQRKTSAGAKRAKEAKAGASGALAPAPAKDADDDDESADSDDESSEEDEEE